MGKSKQKHVVPIIEENKYIIWALLASFLLCVFLASSFKISADDDFFWHLATGRFIVENKYIPDKDVFGFTSGTTEWIPFEWGWDVLTYSLYQLGGYNAILVFRSIIITLIFLIYFLLLKKFKVNSALSILLLFVLLIGFMDRLTARPHIISYLFVVIVLYILLKFRYIDKDRKVKNIYFLPFIFLVWSNFHMGVFLGAGILAVFVISEIIMFYKPSLVRSSGLVPLDKEKFRKFLIISGLSILAMLINPHGIQTYLYAYRHSNMQMLQYIHEWFNPFTGNIDVNFVVTIYKVLLFVGFVTIIYAIKKKDFLYALIYIMFALYSVRAIRFTVDYELIIIFFIAISFQFYLNEILEKKASASGFFYGNVLKIIFIVIFLFVSLQIQSGNIYHIVNYYRLTGFGLDDNYLPVQLFNFIKVNNIKGTPFNNFESGGYLVWNSEGEKNFIDSRNLSDELFGEYNSIFQMKPGFEKKLEQYNIDYCVYYYPEMFLNPNRMKNNINGYLFNNKSWKLVYWDDNALLFVKDIPKFTDIINKYQYTILNPYNMYFSKAVFESDIKNNPSIANNEIERKARTDTNGFFYKNMAALVSKYLRGK